MAHCDGGGGCGALLVAGALLVDDDPDVRAAAAAVVAPTHGAAATSAAAHPSAALAGVFGLLGGAHGRCAAAVGHLDGVLRFGGTLCRLVLPAGGAPDGGAAARDGDGGDAGATAGVRGGGGDSDAEGSDADGGHLGEARDDLYDAEQVNLHAEPVLLAQLAATAARPLVAADRKSVV